MEDKIQLGCIMALVFLFGYIAGNYVAYNQRADIEVKLLNVINELFKKCVIDTEVINQTSVNSTICITVPYNETYIPKNFSLK